MLRTRLGRLVVLACALVLPVQLHAQQRGSSININLGTMNGRQFSFSYPIDAAQASRLRVSPETLRLFVTRAKRDYAKKHIGYQDHHHGNEAFMMVPGLRVLSASMSDRGQRVPLHSAPSTGNPGF